MRHLTEASRTEVFKNLEVFLMGLRFKSGRMRDLPGNTPMNLHQPDTAWIVYSGVTNLFASRDLGVGAYGARMHLLERRPGQLIFGFEPSDHREYNMIAVGGTRTRLIELSCSRLFELAEDLEQRAMVAAMIDDWVDGLARVAHAPLLPLTHTVIEADTRCTIAAHNAIVPDRGVLWVEPEGVSPEILSTDDGRPTTVTSASAVAYGEKKPLVSGQLRLLGGQRALAPDKTPALMPISRLAWASADTDGAVSGRLTEDRLAEGTRRDALGSGIRQLGASAQQSVWSLLTEQTRKDAALIEHSRHAVGESIAASLATLATAVLASPADADRRGKSGDALSEAFFQVALHSGVEDDALRAIREMPADESAAAALRLRALAQASDVHMREVALSGEWWTRDSGALIGFCKHRSPTEFPVALTRHRGKYLASDARSNTAFYISSDTAPAFAPTAYQLYARLPDRPLQLGEFLRFGVSQTVPELVKFALASMLIAVAGLFVPLASGYVLDQIIPIGDRGALLTIAAGLVVSLVVAACLQVYRGHLSARLQMMIDTRLQGALWHRLLNLRPEFFSHYSVGELGNKLGAIGELRRALSGHTLVILLNGLWSLLTLVLLFAYSTQLAITALLVVLACIIMMVSLCAVYVRRQRAVHQDSAKLSGTTLQILSGITRFRSFGVEQLAFSVWSRDYARHKLRTRHVRAASGALLTLSAAAPLAGSAMLFAVAAAAMSTGALQLTSGDFVAFNLIFSGFLNTWAQVALLALPVLRVIPSLESLRPVLSSELEANRRRASSATLTGEIEANHLRFRHAPTQPLAVNEVSFRIAPGEFVAFVGASGSGKSTLFKLLLGVLTPEAGGIFYDGRDLKDLNARAVRRQIGVVLQTSTPMPGDIYSNIVGSWPHLTIEDAWDAARRAGLADDIEKMPMGMYTVVSERGENLSGGQRQRLLIARALANRPRIILFDEATSALDNQTQAIVSESLRQLKVTRVVIAHRLSTIVGADRIYVFDRGQIVQSGSYSHLLGEPGPFAELAKRQQLR